MINAPNFEILKELSTGVFKGDLNFVVQTIFNEIKLFLNLEPFKNKIRFLIGKKQTLVNPEWFFNLGVSRYFQNDELIIEVHEDYNKFLPFILIREIYNLFVPEEIKELELVQHVINQIILNDLERYDLKNEWRKLMISNLENYNLVSFDFIGFERLKSFFKLEGKNGIFFFFYYIRTYQTLISNKIEDIQSIFFDEFQNYFSKTMNDDDIIETVRCLILIFYRVRSYKDLLSFKNYFQEFKRNKLLITDLSLRKFSKNMDWIKNIVTLLLLIKLIGKL